MAAGSAVAAYQLPVWDSPVQVTSNSVADSDPDVAVDDSGNTHMVWQASDGTDQEIFYGTDKNGTWETIQVTSNSVADESPRVAVDAAGKVHIAFNHWAGSDWDIGYANNASGLWWSDSFVQADNQIDPDIARGDSTRIDIAFRSDADGDYEIIHNTFDGLSWVTTQVTDNAVDDAQPSLAVDAGGNAHIVFSEGGAVTADVYYSRVTTGTASTPEVVASDAAWEGAPSVAVDGASRPRVAFVRGLGSSAELGYAAKAYGFWVNGVITSNSVADFEPAVTVDTSADVVYISYTETSVAGGAIWYATNGSGSWQTAELTTTSTDNRHPSLAAEPSGELHLGYAGNDGADQEVYFRGGGRDRVNPTATLEQPSPYWRSGSSVTMNWTASDNQNLAKVEFYYAHLSSGSTWPATSAWTAAGTATASGLSASGTKSFSLSDGEGYYRYFARATDASGNQQALPSTYQARVAVDQTNPSVRGITWSPAEFNPKRRSSKCRYVLKDSFSDRLDIVVKIYNSSGSWVRTITTHKDIDPGVEFSTYTTWNGYGRYGKIVSKGRYRARIRATDESGNYAYGGNYWVRVVY